MDADFGAGELITPDSETPAFRTGSGFDWGESRYTEAMGREIVRRLAAGEALTTICRDPAIPSAPTIYKWAQLHPEFGEAKLAAQAQARRRETRARARKLKKTLARLAERGRASPGPPAAYSDVLAEVICRRLAFGEAMVDICRDADMPCPVTVYAWMRRMPAFAHMVGLARQHQAELKFDLAWKLAVEASPGDVEVARLRIQTLRWQAARLAPRVYAPQAPLPPADLVAQIRREGPDGYAARQNPDLAALSEGEGDWD